jgi:hypothetical protein
MSTATQDLSELKQPELKALLEERGIEFPRGPVANAKLRELLEEGGASGWATKGYDGPQPWEAEEPTIEPAHGKPILASGVSGADVFELCGLLAELGYETDVTEGLNAFGVLGPSGLAAVRRFRDEYGVHEDPSGFAGENADAYVAAWTWEGLLRATGRIS